MQCQKLRTYMETGRVMFLPGRSIRPNPVKNCNKKMPRCQWFSRNQEY